jgi:hypothetical protein
LVNDAVALCQTNQRGDLFIGGIGIKIEIQADFFEPNGYVFGNAERATKIKITLCFDRRAA